MTADPTREPASGAPASSRPSSGKASARRAAPQSETIDAVLFDWGGTLSVFAEVELSDMWRLAAHHFDPSRADEITEVLAAAEAATFARTQTDCVASTLRQILTSASEQLGLDVTEAVLEEAGTHYLDSWTPHIVHEPDAADVLGALRAAGLKTGLLSNTHWPRAFHERFLERDGLAELLDARLYTSELSHMKPHPSVFEAALAAVGVDDPAKAVFVGDRLHDDVFGAKQAGMRGVWRRSTFVPGYDVEPDAVIDTLSDLLPLVKDSVAWNAKSPPTR